MARKKIQLKNVKVHNLKGVDLTLDHGKLICFTGVSGSGKTSLAFDTIYIEGQRRYIESLSAHARRQMGDMPKPQADLISGISPTVAIEQKTAGRNPRSTVGTLTGLYDFLRVLYARIGIAHCPVSGEPVTPQSAERIAHTICAYEQGTKLLILAPFAKEKKAEFVEEFKELLRRGYMRVRIDGKVTELEGITRLDGSVAHTVDIVIDRIKVKTEDRARIKESIAQALQVGGGVMSVVKLDRDEETLFSEHAFSPKSGLSYPPLEPQDFSFNHPSGMCETCHGIGEVEAFDLDLVINPELSITEDCCAIASSYSTVRYGNIYDNLARIGKFKVTTPWKDLSDKAKHLFLEGTTAKWTKMHFVHPESKKRWTEYVNWRGVIFEARKKLEKAKSDVYHNKMKKLMMRGICPVCHGERIKGYAAATKLGGIRLPDVMSYTIEEALHFFNQLKLTPMEETIGLELLKEIRERLGFLLNVGLHYLTLNRSSPTLSGGEAQRVRLASQIGSGLVGATYVLDEPSIGLHPRDNTKLLETLKKLRDKGNTVLVIEHDEETILAADEVVDVGPGAGERGGEIVAHGGLDELLKAKRSETGAYLSRRKQIAVPKKRRKPLKEAISLKGVTHHNLKSVNVKIPLGVFTAVTGVSGSGKSSLISHVLHPALSNALHNGQQRVGKLKKMEGIEAIDKVIAIDQSPIGRTPRSNPATYVKVFDPIRDLYAHLPESVARGFSAGRFSFNVKEGSCPHCTGMGMIKIDMDFMDDEWQTCEHCEGRRFDEQTLSILFKGKSIYDALEMTLEQARDFFGNIPVIAKRLDALLNVGLGYIRLGQPSPTLSGGEAQRIKLAKELARPATGQTLYILDEPTTGLHFADIDKLCSILHALVDRGNSVLVIEHNMDLVKTADQIIDLGPEGGKGGGEIIATGTPEQVAKLSTPTGYAIKSALNPPILKPSEKASQKGAPEMPSISVKGAEQNNLRSIDAEIPRGSITICTGPSGSGKSSFAFDTLYAEGQRRYTESMSAYARTFVKQMAKPAVEGIEGLSPAIAIEQRSHAGNPRSTVGTMTEIYDFLRVLYAHLGTPYCPETGEQIETIGIEKVAEQILKAPEKARTVILAPMQTPRGDKFAETLEKLQSEGYLRIRLNGEILPIDQSISYDSGQRNTLELVIDRLIIGPSIRKRLLEAIEHAAKRASGTLIANIDGKDHFFNLAFAVPSTGKSYPPITPHTFSFNTESGMCAECSGLGIQYGANLMAYPKLMQLTPLALIKLLWKEEASPEALALYQAWQQHEGIPQRTRLEKLNETQLRRLFHGSSAEIPLSKRSMATFKWLGINESLGRAAKTATREVRDTLLPILHQSACPACRGERLKPLARCVKLGKYTLPELCALPIDLAFTELTKINLKKTEKFLKETHEQILHRLKFLEEIGLYYLSLSRSAPTLSGGEAQRIQLARGLGGGLTGCLYVLDEPTIGLHPHNNERLNACLKKLKDLGNTLLLVEHDPLTLQTADKILDFGPGAGTHGGTITASGTLKQILKNKESLTGAYLSGKKSVPIPEKRRKGKDAICIKQANVHNLKNLTVKIPRGTFTCITGVSGSGKSSLMKEILRPAAQKALQLKEAKEIEVQGAHVTGLDAFHKLITIDQSPIGHTNRANIATYTDLYTPLRSHFAQLPESQVRGLKPYHFSFNHLRGMCKACFGLGVRTIEMQFLPPVKVTCDSCLGGRLNSLALEVEYKGKHMGEIFDLTVPEAQQFIGDIPKVQNILETLARVGLDYLKLGQAIQTLSGGEQQRIRLSRELAKRSAGKTLYLFDEPTVGLHADDIARLLPIFQELVDKGHTLVVIEHNTDLIRACDYIIDLGPEAGIHGGEIIATGTPDEIASHPTSHTGRYIKKESMLN